MFVADVNFEVSNIYSLNQSAFGPEKKYDVSEIGLIPFITRYINYDFRDYTLLPIFISKSFRHRNIYVHTDSGIEKPEDLIGKRGDEKTNMQYYMRKENSEKLKKLKGKVVLEEKI